MSEINKIGKTIKVGNKSYRVEFTVRAIDIIQDYYNRHIGDIGKILRENTVLNLAYILTVLINESVKKNGGEYLNIDTVIKHLNVDNVSEYLGNVVEAYSTSFVHRDEDDIGVCDKEPLYNVIRMITIGREMGYTEKEIWSMTPKHIQIMYDDYLIYHGHKKQKVTVDDVIPI